MGSAHPVDVTPNTLYEWIGGLVITNDVSARDIQVSHEQFNEAKSYRTFGPTGYFLVLLSAEEMRRWGELVLTLKVNGEVRENAPASEMIFGPAATLTELSQIRVLQLADMIATGTPIGVALKLAPKALMMATRLMSPEARFKAFMKSQLEHDRYLQPGHELETTIATPDGEIDLGVQRNTIVEASRSHDTQLSAPPIARGCLGKPLRRATNHPNCPHSSSVTMEWNPVRSSSSANAAASKRSSMGWSSNLRAAG